MVDRVNDQKVQCLKMETIHEDERRHYFAAQPMDATAGRIRLCRRGNKMYYLIAENDSNQFRLLGEQEYPADDVPDSGIRFGVQIQGSGGRTEARFTEFELRAERLEGLATEDPDILLARLNTEREQLPVSFAHDFSRKEPDEDTDFYRWTDHDPWEASAGGLQIDAPGSNEWTSAGIGLLDRFYGDFDVRFSFQPIQLATPKEGKHTQVYLQLELHDEDHTQLSCMLTKVPAGDVACQAQLRTPFDNGYQYNNLGTVPIDQPDYLRLAARSNRLLHRGPRWARPSDCQDHNR